MSDERIDNNQDLQTQFILHAQKTEIELKSLNDKFSEHKQETKKHIEILEQISEQVGKTFAGLDKLNSKVDLSTQKLQSEVEKINQLDEQQNRILDEHIAGVNTLKAMHLEQREAIHKRLSELEKPREWLKMTRKGLIWLAGTAAAVMTLLKFLEVI